jgi:hypothetical protein
MNEIRGQFNDVLVISELRGAYPNVPIAADVDYAALIAGDPDPVFVTLPIGKANVTSGNNRHYDDAFVTELLRQTLALKPIGLTGHLTEAERATAFPKESLHWVGAMRDGDLAWGKAYVLGEARDRLRRYKASGKSIATSIDANCDGNWDESLKAYRMDYKTLKLGQIDLAPADRAGIGDLAREPMLTTEMQDEVATMESTTTQEDSVSKEQVLQEIGNAKPAPQQGWMPGNAAEVQELTAIREALGVDEKADLPKLITEMKQEREAQRLAAVKAHIRELASDAEKGIKIVPVREVVINMVEALEPKTADEAEAKYNMIATSGPITELLKDRVVLALGPRQGTRVAGQHGGTVYFVIPAEKQEA